MKLGTQTGSVSNHMMAMAVIGQPEPTVGMGATILAWTDRYAGTIVDIKPLRGFIMVQEDEAKRVDKNGMSESQEYEYTRCKTGRIWHFKRDERGVWHEYRVNEQTGRYNKVKSGHGLRIGERAAYHDFSF